MKVMIRYQDGILVRDKDNLSAVCEIIRHLSLFDSRDPRAHFHINPVDLARMTGLTIEVQQPHGKDGKEKPVRMHRKPPAGKEPIYLTRAKWEFGPTLWIDLAAVQTPYRVKYRKENGVILGLVEFMDGAIATEETAVYAEPRFALLKVVEKLEHALDAVRTAAGNDIERIDDALSVVKTACEELKQLHARIEAYSVEDYQNGKLFS